jgi:two-component system chemotaxis response regulator CheB
VKKRNIIVIGASSGGLEALKSLVGQLHPDFSGYIFIVWHIAPEYPSLLPEILSRAGNLPATHPADGQALQAGHIYVAPPDHHLLVQKEVVCVSRGPRENRFRPSIDVLFRSAAWAIGIVLSGSLDDGASGLYAIKAAGGKAIVQDPSDATYPDMSINAMKAVTADHVVPMSDMGELLMHLVAEDAGMQVENNMADNIEMEVKIARQENAFELGVTTLGDPTLHLPRISRGADAYL